MGKTIVIADDDDTLRQMAASVATRFGYTVVGEAREGDTLVSLVRELNPTTVLTDIEMPGGKKNGLEAITELRQGEYTNPVVIHSGNASVFASQDGQWGQGQEGKNWYSLKLRAILVQKPYDLQGLMYALNTATA